ncbi:spore germination protein [Cytobacillus horneckiae]|uniref:Germination protein YpeB n=1 Tax=Cytobacillus horneckiae TaxID=549687 RepID=A0A2N0ZCW0_9BACI|nr:germination protein YpeB [Cytobacillus horneckiae]MBN6888400.1 germination protein YpeB [Cytobacillus horneckiae]MCM3180127.1 germination protein YpeB [Cytobacillus horneckiae]MEC1156560.1 germination protein YpeB [Cytobacillus horneckiae]MED2938915.1 germination protein YpeB [Cytobacillus horneckiae]PKG27339.1 germination protein YpeB [Cytobacillus horneckiae]
MLRGVLIGALSVGLVGAAVWGYQEHREKNAILINAENNYQRAFHELTYQVDLLHDKIGSTLAMNSRSSLSPALADVWRITSEAHSDVGQLPLALLPFNKTEEFLSQIGDFSYRTAVRDLDKDPLTDEEYQSLQNLYKQAADIQDELRQVQHMVLKNDLRWMDVETALASGNEAADNTIIDGFQTVEKTVEGYDETDLGPAFVNMQKKDENFKYLEGEEITKEEAVKEARKYAGLPKDSKVRVTESGEGSKYGFYSVTIEAPNSQIEANMDITKKGGYPIWFIMARDVKEQNISLNDASNIAIEFLKENGFEDLDLFESAQYDQTGVFTFVSKQDDVRIYPDSIKMKVALDDGKILGFAAEDYLKSHHQREIPEAQLSLEEARAKLNPQVEIMEDRMAVILNDLNQEVLCYEFMATLGNDTYRIFINSEDGREEKVEKLQNAERIYEDVV